MWTTWFLFAAVASVQGGYIPPYSPYSDVSSYDQAIPNKAEAEAPAIKKAEEEATAVEKDTEEDAAAKIANEAAALAKKAEEESFDAKKSEKDDEFNKRQNVVENKVLRATKEKGPNESAKCFNGRECAATKTDKETNEGKNNPRIIIRTTKEKVTKESAECFDGRGCAATKTDKETNEGKNNPRIYKL